MSESHSYSRSALRVLVTWLMLCAQFASATGFPLARSMARDTSRPYPCMDRPCGCLTYDECWAGDCCCYTLGQKLDWAEKHGIEAPAHAKAKACPTDSSGKESCCTVPKTGAKWTTAAYISACRGTHSDSISGSAILLPPVKPVGVAILFPTPAPAFAAMTDRGPVRSDSPPIPPPKSSL